jgi:hypothetical protein
MRRIIERTVTVVTTTTWTISWQDDALHHNPQSDPVDNDFPEADVLNKTTQHTQKFSPVIETKEADPAETKTETDLTSDEPPDDPYFYQSKKGNEKP